MCLQDGGDFIVMKLEILLHLRNTLIAKLSNRVQNETIPGDEYDQKKVSWGDGSFVCILSLIQHSYEIISNKSIYPDFQP
jgi:hypothetical protein